MNTIKVIVNEKFLSVITKRLIGRSAWFEVIPLPDGEWEIVTKPENNKVFIEQSGTPAEDRYGREPDKVKPLAQYLGDYVEHELNENRLNVGYDWHELLQQALDAYESTQNVTIKIERV